MSLQEKHNLPVEQFPLGTTSGLPPINGVIPVRSLKPRWSSQWKQNGAEDSCHKNGYNAGNNWGPSRLYYRRASLPNSSSLELYASKLQARCDVNDLSGVTNKRSSLPNSEEVTTSSLRLTNRRPSLPNSASLELFAGRNTARGQVNSEDITSSVRLTNRRQSLPNSTSLELFAGRYTPRGEVNKLKNNISAKSCEHISDSDDQSSLFKSCRSHGRRLSSDITIKTCSSEENGHEDMSVSSNDRRQSPRRKARTGTPIPSNGIDTNKAPAVVLVPKPPGNTISHKKSHKSNALLPNGLRLPNTMAAKNAQQDKTGTKSNSPRDRDNTESTYDSESRSSPQSQNALNNTNKGFQAKQGNVIFEEVENLNASQVGRILKWVEEVNDAKYGPS
ncbi:uncharacterized protein [Amphiura filiformis]|uniref:uncharacterized protein n=1 Tax=Amphiura filiformis TaxID=82378 RepID=UPI003B218E47